MADAPLTLADVAGPHAPAVVAAIGYAVGQAALQADHRGTLRPVDVGLDGSGMPVIRPSSESESDDDPHQDPTLHEGSSASLYGLGVMLHVLASGRPHGADATRGGQAVPASLQSAIDQLTSANVANRTLGLSALQRMAGPLPDLRLLARRDAAKTEGSRVGEVKFTATQDGQAPTLATASTGPVRAVLAVPADVAASLSSAQRTHLAGLASVPRRAVDDAISEGRSLPVAVGRADDLTRGADHGDLPVAVIDKPGFVAPLIGTLAGVAGLALLAAALPLLALSLIAAGAVAGVGVLALVAALMLWIPWFSASRSHAAVKNAWAAWEPHRALSSHALTGPSRTLLSNIATDLSGSDLSEPAQRDLRDGLREVEDRLASLESQWHGADDALELEAARTHAALQELAQLMQREEEPGTEQATDRLLQIARLAAASRVPT